MGSCLSDTAGLPRKPRQDKLKSSIASRQLLFQAVFSAKATHAPVLHLRDNPLFLRRISGTSKGSAATDDPS